MTQEIPKNEVKTFNRHVRNHAGSLGSLVEKLHENRNVISVRSTRNGAYFDVTVEYAVMDLELQLGALGTTIEELFPKP